MLLLYHVWTPVLVSVFETRNWTNFEEFKTLQHVLLLELNLVKAILAASRITYNIRSICRPCYNNIIHHEVFVYSPNHLYCPHCELCDIR